MKELLPNIGQSNMDNRPQELVRIVFIKKHPFVLVRLQILLLKAQLIFWRCFIWIFGLKRTRAIVKYLGLMK